MNRIFLLLATAALFCGCSHYQLGSLTHPDLEAISLGTLKNDTTNPRLGHFLKQSLPTAFVRDGGVSIQRDATASLDTTITRFLLNGVGEVPTQLDDSDQDSYRTSVYDVSVDVTYTLRRVSDNSVVLESRTVTGRARLSELGDLNATLEEGAQRAVTDAANQIVTGVTEAW